MERSGSDQSRWGVGTEPSRDLSSRPSLDETLRTPRKRGSNRDVLGRRSRGWGAGRNPGGRPDRPRDVQDSHDLRSMHQPDSGSRGPPRRGTTSPSLGRSTVGLLFERGAVWSLGSTLQVTHDGGPVVYVCLGRGDDPGQEGGGRPGWGGWGRRPRLDEVPKGTEVLVYDRELREEVDVPTP